MSSSSRICPSLFFILFSFFCRTYGYGASSSNISYNDHCASVVPESSSTVRAEVDDLLALEKWTSYYTGGEDIFGRIFSSNYRRSLTFYITRKSYETITPGVYKIEAYLKLQSPGRFGFSNYSTSDLYRNNSSRSSQLVFLLNGFWSESTRKLCMVGSASRQSEAGGRLLELEAVLKLKYAPEKSTIFTSVVDGKLESLSLPKDSSTYFHPVKIVSFPLIRGYNFTLVPKDGGGGLCLGGINNVRSLNLKSRRMCSYLSGQPYDFVLDYAPVCNSDSNNCSPLQIQGDVPYLPRMISLSVTQCSEEEEKLRYMIRFPNNSYSWDSWYNYPLDPRTTLIGEGSWQRKKNQMCIVACRILNSSTSSTSSGDASVGDCSIRLCFRFPSVRTINSTSLIVGEIWTNNSVNSPGYFKKIICRSLGDHEYLRFPELKYEYTAVTKARESCSVKEPARRGGGKYPKGNSNDMRFQLSIKHSGEHVGWGEAKPIAVGDDIYEGNMMIISDWEEGVSHSDPVIDENGGNVNTTRLTNISYNIILNSFLDFKTQFSSLNYSLNPKGSLEITAEGMYDAERGLICMVGCRHLYSYSNNNHKAFKKSLDCEILVNIEFPSQDSSQSNSIEGSIQSRRSKTDPLYFDRLNISSYYYSVMQAEQLIWRMDLEIIMVLISNSLACIFVILQIFHVKKHPQKLPFISMAMLIILTLGHFIPLVLNFEALILKNQYHHNVIFRGSGWLEVNEMSVRLVTMIVFILLSRLLQLAWNSRLADGNVNHHSWTAEKRVLFVSLPLYIAGGLITILVSLNSNLKKTDYRQGIDRQQVSTTTLEYLRSYSGLIVDGFLLPQILLNMFQSSKQSALSKPFYLGTTLVRLLPHAYDLYRIHNFVHRDFNGSDIYANPDADFYSVAWDVIILGGCILFAVIIWIQQRFGGRYILPGKLKEIEL